MHNDIKEILLTKQEIDMMVHKIASSVNDDFRGEEVTAVVIL